ncbi:CdaR family protein [Niameybacter massiliensis]|uniref:CdaR family protein n=1 Tax=Holtiella tumoricola TaxID=3018743 RepID=A0AA42DJB9_9FIRM|nr:CdaR family protein [Holtiella tumoricola]MDA3730014.1 CdaR family protein [Holtiella tumoricola]
MNRFLSNNLPWKIVSFLLAALLWFFVINSQNPVLTKEVRVPLTIRGINELEAKGYVLQNEEELRNMQVRVLLKGPRLDMERLASDAVQIDARLDLTQYANMLTAEDADSIDKTVRVPVYISVDSITAEDIRPRDISVIFEREKSTTKEIIYNIENESSSEYAALDPILKPSEVVISGPKSGVESVETAVININVENFSEDTLSYTVPITLLDKDGQEVTGVKKVPEYVEVTLPIGKKKKVPLEPQFKGTLPAGYIQTNIIINPKEITIVGKPEVVDQINSIKLEKIALDNIIQSNTFRADFILPEGIEYIDNIESKANVTLEIQKETDYSYDISLEEMKLQVLGLPEDYKYEMVNPSVNVILASTAEKLLGFTSDQLKGTIDFSKIRPLSNGEYKMPLQLVVPEGFKVVNTPIYLNIKVEKIQEEVIPPVTEEPVEPPVEGEVTQPEGEE